MKVLLDSCVAGGVAPALAAAGHDVISAGDWPSDPGDEEILAAAQAQNRVLVTLDKDFWGTGDCQRQAALRNYSAGESKGASTSCALRSGPGNPFERLSQEKDHYGANRKIAGADRVSVYSLGGLGASVRP